MRVDSGLISISIAIFIAGMLLEGLLFLPIISNSLKAQVETFTVYILTTSLVIQVVVGISSIFKRKL